MKNNLAKKYRCFLLLIFSFNHLKSKPLIKESLVQLKGSIEAPSTLKDIPEFVIRFRGKQTLNEPDGIFSFIVDDKNSKDVSTILICENIFEAKKKKSQYKHSKSTLNNFLVDISKPYKFYELEPSEDNSLEWKQKKLYSIKDSTFSKIPTNTIILLANPEIVDTIKSWPILISLNYIQGPKIILKNINTEEIKKASEISLAKSIDRACYFEKNQIKIVSAPNKNKIAIPLIERA